MRPINTILRRAWGALGPGLTTGAADDDPSGIATYSQAGAQFGYALTWTMALTLPFMAAIQSTRSSARRRSAARGLQPPRSIRSSCCSGPQC
jgi:Mn2+/Fe2+ NRAMP family transporter